VKGKLVGESNLITFCPDCGARVLEDAKFCGMCGLPRANMEDPSTAEDLEDIASDSNYQELYSTFGEEESTVSNDLEPKRKKNSLIWVGAVGVVLISVMAIASNNSDQGSTLASASPTNSTSDSQAATPSQATTEAPPQNAPTAVAPSPSKSAVTSAKTVVVPKPSPRKVDQCEIDSQTITDVISFVNLIAVVPSGHLSSTRIPDILSWAQSATDLSDVLTNDAGNSNGRIVVLMLGSATDLSELASLASDWASDNISDPANFPAQYSSASSRVQTDYAKMASLCGSKLPGL
jgi:zinc-ribbon domain